MTVSSMRRSIGKVAILQVNREGGLRKIGEATGNPTIGRPRTRVQDSGAAREELVQSARQEVEPAGQ